MENCSSVATPYVKEDGGKAGEGDGGVIEDQARVTKFRRAAARINYMALDDPRIAYASKQISQVMSKPTEEGEVCIKRVLRFLRGRPWCEWRFPWQEMPIHLVGYSDSDWAGCTKTRRSTSGGGITLGQHLLTHWSRAQSCVALSSGEAELNAMLKAACEGLSVRYLLEEIGEKRMLH